MRRGYMLVWFVPCIVLCFAATSLAQTTGTILGSVKDSTSAVVPGASVTVTNNATKAARSVLSDEVGNYVIPLLQAGDYEITAELAGFQKVIRKITLEVDQRARVDITLSVGSVT